MVNFFVYQIIDGRCTLNDIHKLWRAKVQARLRELGLDDNGQPLPTDTDDEGQAM